jgi:hypothetical protein
MGILDIFQPQQHVLRSSIKNWRLKVEHPVDFDDPEQRPFEDPHFYSDSESESEELSPGEGKEPEDLIPGEEEEPEDLIPEPPKERKPYILHSPALLPPIENQNLVMSQIEYSNVVFSQWQNPWELAARQNQAAQNYTPSYSRRFSGATSEDGAYQRLTGKIRYTRFNYDGNSDDSNSSEESGDEEGKSTQGVRQFCSVSHHSNHQQVLDLQMQMPVRKHQVLMLHRFLPYVSNSP